MGIRKQHRELDSLESIVRLPSPKAREREVYIQEKKHGGCALCESHFRIAFYHRDPSTKRFDIQKAGITIPLEVLDAEIQKCVVLCVSCRMKMQGQHRPTGRISNKKLFFELQKAYSAPVRPGKAKKRRNP